MKAPKSIEEAQREMNAIRAELDTEKVPTWRRVELERRMTFLRGYLVGKGAFEKDNLQEPAPNTDKLEE